MKTIHSHRFTDKQYQVVEIVADLALLLDRDQVTAGSSLPAEDVLASLVGEFAGNTKSWRSILRRITEKGLPFALEDDRVTWNSDGGQIIAEINGWSESQPALSLVPEPVAEPEPEPEPEPDEAPVSQPAATPELHAVPDTDARKGRRTSESSKPLSERQKNALRVIARFYRDSGDLETTVYTTELPAKEVYAELVKQYGSTSRSWSSVVAWLAWHGICHTDKTSRYIIIDDADRLVNI